MNAYSNQDYVEARFNICLSVCLFTHSDLVGYCKHPEGWREGDEGTGSGEEEPMIRINFRGFSNF